MEADVPGYPPLRSSLSWGVGGRAQGCDCGRVLQREARAGQVVAGCPNPLYAIRSVPNSTRVEQHSDDANLYGNKWLERAQP